MNKLILLIQKLKVIKEKKMKLVIKIRIRSIIKLIIVIKNL